MTAPTLRPYQHLARLDVSRVWRSGGRGALLVLPTGAGKTVTAYSIVDREIAEGRRVLWLAHVDVLLGQSVRTAARFGHADAGVVKAGWTSPEAVLQIGSMQTLGRRLEAAARRFTPDLIVVDEAHRAVCATYVRILAAWPAARILGCTATPWRGDGRGLGEAFGAIVCPTTPQRLIDQGHLVPPLMRRLQWQPDLAGVHRRAGEYATAEVEKACAPGLGDVADACERAIAEGDAPVLAFAVSVAHSVALRDELLRRGVRAAHVDADTDTETRDDLLGEGGALASGAVQVVCSVGVLDEGVDCPDVRTVVLSPTASSSRYLQRVGRGLRPAPGKAHCRVVDAGGNYARHWWPTEDVSPFYDLEGAPDARKVRGETEEASIRACGACLALHAARAWPRGAPCPSCGRLEPGKAVRVETKGMVESEVRREDLVPWSDKASAWSGLCDETVERGYSWKWALMAFRRRYGHAPSRAMLAGLRGRTERAA